MLAALIGLVVVTFIGWYVSIMKKFMNFVKGKYEFTNLQLVSLLISNFIVVIVGVLLVGVIIGSIIEESKPSHTMSGASLMVIIPLILGIIISLLGDYLIYKFYTRKLKDKERKI